MTHVNCVQCLEGHLACGIPKDFCYIRNHRGMYKKHSGMSTVLG